MKTISTLSIAVTLGTGLSALGQSVWLPEPGEFLATPAFTYQTYDRYWSGLVKTPKGLPVHQETASLTLEYGLCESAAADISFGYVWLDTRNFGPPGVKRTDDGLTDTSLGLRYRFLDENKVSCKFAPSLALRVGGNIAGTYNPNFVYSAGDGASGVEGSLLMGKAICRGFGIYGDIGYRYRDSNVPDDVFGSAGLYATYKFATATVAYRHVEGQSGLDLGTPFPPGQGFPQLKEVSQNIEVGLSLRDKGGRSCQFFYAHTIDGRNTGQKDIFGVSVTLPFGGRK